MNSDSLVAQFAQAKLPLMVSAQPLTRGGGFDIFQLDIARQRGERFVLFPGAGDNRVLVQGRDASLQQLVLMVEEGRRPFTVQLRLDEARAARDEIVSVKGRFATVRRYTDASKRHLLCGRDEQHLFIAPLSARVSTVKAAHDALFNPVVKQATDRAGVEAIRQGEWFFVPATASDLSAIAARLRRALFTRHQVPVTDGIGARRGRPHRVDELIVLPEGPARVTAQVFVRGLVRHPDHKTVRLNGWHRVFGNREAPPVRGVSWVD